MAGKETKMDDKLIMDNILTSVKSSCDLLLHASIESSTGNVHTAFKQVLDDSLCLQNEIYAKMSAKGWYPETKAEQQKIDQTKQKYSAM